MLILDPVYIRVTSHFNYLSVLSQYLGAAGTEQLPCCCNTRKTLFLCVSSLKGFTAWDRQTDRQTEWRKQETDKPFSSSELPKLPAVLCQPTAQTPLHLAESVHPISIRHSHFLQNSLMNCRDFLPVEWKLWKCQTWRVLFLIRKSRDKTLWASNVPVCLRCPSCSQVMCGLLSISCPGLCQCHHLSAARSKSCGEPPEHQGALAVLGRTAGTELLGSPLLFRQQGRWVRQGGWWGKARRMRSGSSLASTTQAELEGAAKLWSFQTQTGTSPCRKCICFSCLVGDGEHRTSVYNSVYRNISPPLSGQLKWNTLRIAVLKSL